MGREGGIKRAGKTNVRNWESWDDICKMVGLILQSQWTGKMSGREGGVCGMLQGKLEGVFMLNERP